MIRVFSTLLGLFMSVEAFSQVDEIQATVAPGGTKGSVSLAYGRDWELWKNKTFAVGIGGRFTSFFGSNQHFITAPAKLTSGSTGPLVIFKENIDENIDTFLIRSPQVNSINILINLAYRISNKFHVGFNIDLAGFSFGRKKNGTFISNDQKTKIKANPTAFNVLLISDNDRGSLNSELYGKYYWSEKIGIKFGAQFLFTEYTTKTEIQQSPEPNDRFRNKSLMFAVGFAYKL